MKYLALALPMALLLTACSSSSSKPSSKLEERIAKLEKRIVELEGVAGFNNDKLTKMEVSMKQMATLMMVSAGNRAQPSYVPGRTTVNTGGHCTHCNGSGHIGMTCGFCKGSGRDKGGAFACGFCKGMRFIPCTYCRGTGRQ